MRAMEVWGSGEENIKEVEQPDPQPGPGEVQVRIVAATLNYRDLAIPEGGGPFPVKMPYVPLSCGCGVVTALGEGVTRVHVGDRVAPTFFQPATTNGQDAADFAKALGGPINGVARELACFPHGGVVKIPDDLSDLEAATLPCAGLTAWNALFGARATKPGDVVVLLGTGGVSIAGLQLAKAAGASAIITSSSDAKLARARALGADHTINYRALPAWGGRAHTLAGGSGADVVLEVGGTGTLAQSLAALRPGGDVASIGLLAGGIVSQLDEATAKLHRIRVGTRDQFEDMLRALVRNRVRPVVDKVYPLKELGKAMAALRAGTMVGKVGIQIA